MGIPMEIAEARLMGLDHSDILQQALEHWKFPRDFTLPVIHHHKPVTRIKKLAANDLEHAAVLRLADKMANALMLGNSGNEIIYPLDDLVDLMGIGEATFTQIAENTPDETQSLKLSLIARSNADIGDNLGTQKAKRLKTGVQAVVAAARLWSNPLRMFFRRLAAYAGNDEPNLGIIYLRNATEQDAVLKDYELQERKANVGVLPVLILLETGNLPVNREWVERRRHAVITMPVRIDHLIDKINHLLVDCLVSSGQARR